MLQMFAQQILASLLPDANELQRRGDQRGEGLVVDRREHRLERDVRVCTLRAYHDDVVGVQRAVATGGVHFFPPLIFMGRDFFQERQSLAAGAGAGFAQFMGALQRGVLAVELAERFQVVIARGIEGVSRAGQLELAQRGYDLLD